MKISSILGYRCKSADLQRAEEKEQEAKVCEEESLSSLEMRDSPRSVVGITACEAEVGLSEENLRKQCEAVCQKIKEFVEDFLHPYITGQIKTRDYEKELALEALLTRSLSIGERSVVQISSKNYLEIAARCFMRKGIQGYYQNCRAGMDILVRERDYSFSTVRYLRNGQKLIAATHSLLVEEDTDHYNYLKSIVQNAFIQEFPSIGWTKRQLTSVWNECFQEELMLRVRDIKRTSYVPVIFTSFSGRSISLKG